MPRWNNSLEDNIKIVMDTVIKNLKPNLYQQLLTETVNSNINNSKKVIEQFLRSRLNLTNTLSKHTKGYWLQRGWSADEAYVKSKENKQKNCKSVYSKEFWLEKINPATGTFYTPTEADFERNCRRPIRKEYWIKQGFSEIDAIRLAKETKDQNNKQGSKNSATSSVRRITSKRCIEYYTSRGSSAEEATQLVSDSQRYFSKRICIEKYGESEGVKIWQNRQTAWQAKLNAKSVEEKARINRAKLSKGITVSKAEKIIVKELVNFGIIASTQFTLFQGNKKQFVYDIMYNNKIVEYNGDFWHSNPAVYKENYLNPRTKLLAKDRWKKDQEKIQFAIDHGYKVLVIWESEFKQNQKETINKCIQFLTQ